MLMIEPPLACPFIIAAACDMKKADVRFSWITFDQRRRAGRRVDFGTAPGVVDQHVEGRRGRARCPDQCGTAALTYVAAAKFELSPARLQTVRPLRPQTMTVAPLRNAWQSRADARRSTGHEGRSHKSSTAFATIAPRFARGPSWRRPEVESGFDYHDDVFIDA